MKAREKNIFSNQNQMIFIFTASNTEPDLIFSKKLKYIGLVELLTGGNSEVMI